MLECFYPREYLASTYQIDFEKMYGQGYRGIIFDIDNTLVPHGLPADKRAIALFGRLFNNRYHLRGGDKLIKALSDTKPKKVVKTNHYEEGKKKLAQYFGH